MRPQRNGLVAWALGTFHTSVFGLALLLLFYPRGGLGSVLQGLSTLTGLALFIALWATTMYTTRRALSGLDWLADEPLVMDVFFRRALRWGGANGVLFLAALGGILLLNALVTAPSSVTLAAVLGIGAFVGAFGSVAAFVVGALVGVTLGALDVAALRIARAVRLTAESNSPL